MEASLEETVQLFSADVSSSFQGSIGLFSYSNKSWGELDFWLSGYELHASLHIGRVLVASGGALYLVECEVHDDQDGNDHYYAHCCARVKRDEGVFVRIVPLLCLLLPWPYCLRFSRPLMHLSPF